MIGVLLLAALACPVEAPQVDAGAEQARVALAAAPERPGLALAYGRRLLDAGALDGAEGCARRVLARWPAAVRARLLLARVALARGDRAGAEALLADVEARGPAPAVVEARRIRGAMPPVVAPAGRWVARLAVGGHYDTRAATLAAVEDPLPRAADPAALRGVLTGDVGYVRASPQRLWRVRLGLDRTAHAVTDDQVEPGPLDRTSLWADGQFEQRVGGGRLGVGGELRGTLAGRLGEPHHVAAGLLGWWRRPRATFAPWVRLRGYGFAFADDTGREPVEAWTELAAGGRVSVGPFAIDGRLGGQWVGPGERGFYGVGADVRPEYGGRLGAVYLVGGFGWRRATGVDVLVPRAGVGAVLRLGERWSLGADAVWQRAWRVDGRGEVDRLVAGLIAEVIW